MREWSYIDDIKFVGYQLNHYYPNGWPRRYCADIVGISNSTQRKYENIDWLLTKEEADYVRGLIDYSNNEIKTLVYDKNFRYFAGEHDIIKEKRQELVTLATIIEYTQQDLKVCTNYNPKYNYILPKKHGLYMLAQIGSLPTKPHEQLYMIKVGQSINLKNRVGSYKGMNPLASLIDIKLTKNLNEEESRCHNFLSTLGTSVNDTEWFVVPEEEYTKFLELGFKYCG